MIKMKYTLDLTDRNLPIEKIGGKALNLNRMISAGFNIPPAFVVTVDAYNQFINNELKDEIKQILNTVDFKDEKSLIQGCSNIRNIIRSSEIPEELTIEIHEKIKSLPYEYYAVRSSAVAEDLPDASFAGQLDSFLNIKSEAIPEKIIECWASYWNTRAVKYRHDSRIEQLDTDISTSGIAVVIQKMVDAKVSGVMFTSNPVDGRKNIVIESTYGLGEAIVSGIVTPDIYIMNRDGKIIEKEINNKEVGIYLVNGKNTTITMEDGEKSSLNEPLLHKLLENAVELESYFHQPQDIEWSVESDGEIYILQSRPITTLQDGDDILWTRAYGDEYWADATTPLFFDVMGKMLTDYVNHEGARIMGYKEITDTKLLKLYKSRVYFNTWVLEKAFSYYPKFARSKELLNYFPVDDQERISRYPSILHKTLLSQVLIAIRDPDGMMHNTDKAYRRWASGFMEKCKEFDSKDLSQLSDDELLNLYFDIENAGIKHYQLIRYGMVSHSIATNLMIKNWLINWLDDQDGSLYASLISGLDDNKTVEMNIRLADLARIVRKHPELKEHVDSNHPLEDLLKSNTDFKRELDLFTDDYGHRSNTREILYPRWREDQKYIFEVIKTLSSSNLDLRKQEKESRKQRLKTEKEVQKRIKSLKGGFFKVRLFNMVLGLAQTYLTFRENQRFYLDHLLYRQRLMLLEMGRRLYDMKIIDDKNDVFFLQERELFSYFQLDDEPLLKDEIHLRKMEFYRYKNTLPPKFIKNGIEFDDTRTEYDGNTVYGAAASPGIFTGRARVVESIEDLSLLKDHEILITSNTDPAWTAVFSKIGGLITETGGILSHGAVISREYRIPAVTAVKGATEIFQTGDELVVDGNEGLVHKKA